MEFSGAEVIPNLLHFIPILLYFYVHLCNNSALEVSNRRRRFEVNSGICTMIPALISLQRRGVFCRPRFAFASSTSKFGNSPFRFLSS